MLVLAALLAASRPARSEEGADPGAEGRPRAEARVRALPMPDLAEDPSAFATILETDDTRGEGKTVAELLKRVPGVQVRQFGGPGQLSEVSIRGSTSRQVVVLLDGIRLNSAQTGSVDLSTLPIGMIERIEVTRSAGSVQTGSDAIGGVVNLVSRRPGDDPLTVVGASGGSFGTWEGGFSHSLRTDDDRELSIGYQGFTTDGDWHFQTAESRGVVTLPSEELRRINNDAESHAGTLRLSDPIADAWRLSLDEQIFFRSRGEPGLDRRQNPDAHERRTRNVLGLRLEGEDLFDGAVQTRILAFHRYERVRYRDPDPPSPGLPIDGRDVNQSVGLQGETEIEAETGWLAHWATGSAELRRDSLQSRQFRDPDRMVVGLVAQDELSVLERRIALVPALRFDYTEGEGTEWVPRIGAVVSPWPWLRLKANWEESYRVPNYEERFFDFGSLRGNPNLEPEKATSWDAGLELGVASLGPFESVRFEAAYFERDIRNSIVFQQVSPDTVAATNTGDADVRGVELAASVDLLGWLELSANYTWQDADLQGDEPDALIQGGGGSRSLPGRADEEWSLRARLGPPSRAWSLSAEQHHVSKIPVNPSGSSTVSARTTYDASLVLDLVQLSPWRIPSGPESVLVSAVATNFTDRSVRDALGFPQPGRSLTFGGEIRW